MDLGKIRSDGKKLKQLQDTFLGKSMPKIILNILMGNQNDGDFRYGEAVIVGWDMFNHWNQSVIVIVNDDNEWYIGYATYMKNEETLYTTDLFPFKATGGFEKVEIEPAFSKWWELQLSIQEEYNKTISQIMDNVTQ